MNTEAPNTVHESTGVDVVIVNWNAGEMLLRCVQSLVDFAEVPV